MKVVEQLYDCGPGQRPRRGRAAASPYLFTGLLHCSVCHGSITIVSGRWKKREDSRYGCSMHGYRGDRVCTNNLLIARGALEKQLLAGLQAKVLDPDVIEYALQTFEEQLLRAVNRLGNRSASFERRVAEIQKQIRNCTDVIAEGKRYPSLRPRVGPHAGRAAA